MFLLLATQRNGNCAKIKATRFASRSVGKLVQNETQYENPRPTAGRQVRQDTVKCIGRHIDGNSRGLFGELSPGPLPKRESATRPNRQLIRISFKALIANGFQRNKIRSAWPFIFVSVSLRSVLARHVLVYLASFPCFNHPFAETCNGPLTQVEFRLYIRSGPLMSKPQVEFRHYTRSKSFLTSATVPLEFLVQPEDGSSVSFLIFMSHQSYASFLSHQRNYPSSSTQQFSD